MGRVTIDKTNTPEEVIDLVNEKDEVIGEVTKGKANSNPKLIHREIVILLFDDKKRVLFQQRSRKKKVNPGIWAESVAGHIPKGMIVEEAAHRELLEELGIDTKLKFIEKVLVEIPNETHFASWFIGKYKGQQITLEPAEVEQVKLLSKEEMEAMIAQGIPFGQAIVDMANRFWKREFDELISNL